MTSALALRLRALREPELRQSQLAAVLGVSAALVSSWEVGASIPPRRRLQQYAEYFHDEAPEVLLTELMLLREIVKPPVREPPTDEGMLGVLKDIRWLLLEIRDRLPPPAQSGPVHRPDQT